MTPTPLPSTDAAPQSRSRKVLMAAAFVVLAILFVWQVRKLLEDPTVFPPDDFVEYWAAGNLNAHGKNPYDEKLLYELQQRETTRHEDFAVVMWNPPWTLTFVMPYGLLPSRDAQLLWTLQNFLIVLICADWLWRLYGGPIRFRWVAWLLTLTFMPTLFALGAGQIPPLTLLGITLFLAFERKGWHYLAGAACVLVAIKPHLMYLFWVALAVWGCRGGRRVLVGGTIAGIIATAIPMLCNSDVLSQYREAMKVGPAQWKSPTLGWVLRELQGGELARPNFVLQFVPVAIGLAFLAWYAWRRRAGKWVWLDEMPVLLLASFVTASYGAWPYDVLILLPVVMQIAAGIARQGDRKLIVLGVLAFAAVNVPALILNLFKIGSHWFIWMAPLILVFYLLFLPRVTLAYASGFPVMRVTANRPPTS